MKCTKCKVELTKDNTVCPLCGSRGIDVPSRFSCVCTPYPARATAVKRVRRFLRRAAV